MRKECWISAVVLLFAVGCRDATEPTSLDAGAAVVATGMAAVGDGVHAPPQVEPGQAFQMSFTLKNTGGGTAEYADVALAVLRPDGSHAYDAAHWTKVAVPSGGTWHGSVITTLFPSSVTGTWKAIARGRVSGGNWFNFAAQGGTNPEPFQVVTNGAFIATLNAVNVFPSSVPPNGRPQITAIIQNRSTPNTEWQGDATFNIHAAVRRNGTLVKEQEWNRRAFRYDQSMSGFPVDADYTTATPGAYDVTYTVRTGDGVHVLAVRREAFWVELQPVETACAAPPEANNPVSYVSFRAPPYGFKAATPWLSVVHDRSQPGVASMVEIDFIRLWGRFGRGVDQVISANEFEDSVFGGQLAARSPWYGGPIEAMPGTISNGVLVIRPSDRQDRVWHPYLEKFPRADITGAQDVRFEVRYRITGPALLQAGLDYWQHVHGTSATSRNEEAAATDWHCGQGTWNTVWLEPSTQAGMIWTESTVGRVHEARVGVPVRGSFTVHNYDDDTIRLQEVGIETRRVVNGDPYCDHAISARDTLGFGWVPGGAVLAPGATLTHTSQWTPREPGTYCMKVVEKRQWTPTGLYQTVYSPRQHRIYVAP